MALVPDEFRDSCHDFIDSERPSISCFSDGMSHFYDSYESLEELEAAWDVRLDFYEITREVANCFDDPTPAPCEGAYRSGDLDPAGRVAGVIDDNLNWVLFSHDHALVMGTVLSSSRDYAEVFEFWANEVVLNYQP